MQMYIHKYCMTTQMQFILKEYGLPYIIQEKGSKWTFNMV